MIDTGYRLSLSLFYSFSEKKKDEPLLGWSYEAYLIIKKGKGFFIFSWCAGAHFRFPFTSMGSRGSYAAAFLGPFLLVLRPEAIASS